MQATIGTRRFDLGRFKVAAAAIGILGSLAVGAAVATTLTDSADSRSGSAAVTAPQAIHVEQAGEGIVGGNGQTAARPDTVDATAYYVPGAGEGLFNPNGGESVEPVRSLAPDELRFIEDNVNLPGWTTRSATPDYRMLDQNVLPGDDVQNVPPFVDRVPGVY